MELRRLAAGVLSHPDPAPPAVAFAVEELSRYLARLFGRTPTRVARRGVPGAWLHLAATAEAPLPAVEPPRDAEAEVRPTADGCVVVARTPRALLAAVYALLEAAGCAWSPLGAEHEHVPVRPEAPVPALVLRPPFARRSWTADVSTWHYTMPERLAARLPGDVAFVDWVAKTGGTGMLFIRHANDDRWAIPELLPELARRGLTLEGGGHALVELLPRALFATHPEYFPVGAGGERTDMGNACGSSPGALAVVRDRARGVCDALGVPDLHLWPLDLFGGGWCRCDACAALSPSDQALRVANAAAEGLDADVYHLAYHDTIAPPVAVRPHPRVRVEFAPRERCYAHALDDPRCPTNPRYRDALARLITLFDGRVDAFEYYGDAILFGGCAVPLPGVIAADLDCYRRMGVRGVSCLTFGRYSLLAYGVNVEAFARGARGADAAPAAASWARRYGDGAPAMAAYVGALERVMAGVVTYGDVHLPPEDEDVRAALSAALAAAPAVRRLVGDAAARAANGGSPWLAAECRLLDYTFASLAALRAWLDARLTTPAGSDRDAAGERALVDLARAAVHVRHVAPEIAGTWGAYDLELTANVFAGWLRARAGG